MPLTKENINNNLAKSQFIIAAAYQWPKINSKIKNKNSELAIKKVVDSIKKKFKNKKHRKSKIDFNIAYKRIRGSAGRSILDSIYLRIKKSNVIIFDISQPNENVFLELGIATCMTKCRKDLSVYIIKEKYNKTDSFIKVPSDLQGYFISEYIFIKGRPIFQDNNSLLMSISSDINDFFGEHGFLIGINDEINFRRK